MSPTASDPRSFYQVQDPSPGTAINPTPLDVAQGFAAAETNPSPLPKLFQPLKIRDSTIKNRLWVSPMCMYSAEDGFTTDFHLEHYGGFASRGAGLITIEATGVTPYGRITPNCLGLWKDEHIDGMRRIVSYMHRYGATASIQLGHSGRKGSTIPLQLYGKRPSLRAPAEEGGWPDEVAGPSAIAYDDNHWTPHELTIDEIKGIQQSFADAAGRADKAGFDVIEIHGAHGYLISSFLSPTSNRRTDEYGGSFENRIRMLVETVRAIRKVWPKGKPLFARISATEWVEGGWTIDDTIELAKVLVKEGVDLMDCSTAGNSNKQQIPLSPGYQVQFAEAVKRAVPEMLTGAVGIITKGTQANEIVEAGSADAVLVAREFLRNPSFVLSAAHELHVFIKWSNQFERGRLKTKYSFV